MREREREKTFQLQSQNNQKLLDKQLVYSKFTRTYTHTHTHERHSYEKKLQGTYDREERARREDICVFEKREKWKPPPCLISKTADTYLELAHDQGKKMSSVRSIHCLVDAMH